jgi:cytoskeletal protein CcmA (bactofilin family)
VFSVNSKTDLDKTNPAPARGSVLGAAPTRTESSPFDRASAPETGISVIGTDLTLLGEKITIVSQNKLQVDGDVRGNVHGKQVVITSEGSVVGMVSAEKIEVHGGVRGSIRAVTVTLHASAQVEGDIMHHTLAISEGARFEGNVRRSTDTQSLMPVLDPEAIAAGQYNTGI